ncbi:hypothetical protein Mapa_003313 [Marchantia paleacea]|nr:hypothetical protein Mapa_003313 [Marchantia paleacea]
MVGSRALPHEGYRSYRLVRNRDERSLKQLNLIFLRCSNLKNGKAAVIGSHAGSRNRLQRQRNSLAW